MNSRRLRQSTPVLFIVVAAAAVGLVLSLLVLIQSTRQSMADDSPRRTVLLSLTEGEELRITYLGDSLTAGLHASTEEATYRYQTTTALAGGGPYEENGLNIVGGTVEETLEGNDEFPQDQSIYIVELGTNDVNDVDYRAFNRQYEDLLERVDEASPDAALVCLGTWRPPGRGGNYDLMIRQQCERHGGEYRRLSDLESEPSHKGPAGEETYKGLSDDFHPNDDGHAAIHERVMEAIDVERAG